MGHSGRRSRRPLLGTLSAAARDKRSGLRSVTAARLCPGDHLAEGEFALPAQSAPTPSPESMACVCPAFQTGVGVVSSRLPGSGRLNGSAGSREQILDAATERRKPSRTCYSSYAWSFET